MRTTVIKRARRPARKPVRRPRKPPTANAASMIRQIGGQWARHWNAGDLDAVVAFYAQDAVYFPAHHPAVHGRLAIHEYLRGPLRHGVRDLAFEVTYIKQSGQVAWDVGTYRMNVPQSDGSTKEDRGKYLTVWKRVGPRWLIAADAWSSDLLPAHE